MKAEFMTIAANLDLSSSDLLRRALNDALPALRAESKAKVATRAGFPGNIPAKAIEEEVEQFLKAIARSEPLSVVPREIMSARGLALQQLLNWILSPSETPTEAKVADKVTAWMAALDLGAVAAAKPAAAPEAEVAAPPPAYVPQSKPIKPYPRRT